LAFLTEHGIKVVVKDRFFGRLAIASDLVTLGGAAFTLAALFQTPIDTGAVLMVMTAAFGWGGAVLGTIDIHFAKHLTSNFNLRTVPQGVQILPFPPYLDRAIIHRRSQPWASPRLFDELRRNPS
jgi:hypothetical protein